MAEPKRKVEELKRSELIDALARSRVDMSDDLVDIGDSLSLSRRVSRSYQDHLGIWLSASFVVGFLLSRPRLPQRSSGDSKKSSRAVSGALQVIARQGSRLALPLLKSALSSSIERLLTSRTSEVEPKDESSTLD